MWGTGARHQEGTIPEERKGRLGDSELEHEDVTGPLQTEGHSAKQPGLYKNISIVEEKSEGGELWSEAGERHPAAEVMQGLDGVPSPN